ncbi:MAG TPA: aminotransferase class IV [Candidatus Saccharimonadales bacterium]
MTYEYFSHNGEILPIDRAVIPLNNIEYSYGFGVYETVRLAKGTLYFPDDHCRRLMESARIIGLAHNFSEASVRAALEALIAGNKAETCNLKILLIGGSGADKASLDILCLNPLFPDHRLYEEGATCTTYDYERAFPGAKTLNMLQSYIAYREAKQADAYDALLVDREGRLTEGTRTNFFAVKGRTLVTPPAKYVLPGVTRHYLIKAAERQGFEVAEREIELANISEYDGACLTSTSAKVMPIRSLGKQAWPTIAPAITELVSAFDGFLHEYVQTASGKNLQS